MDNTLHQNRQDEVETESSNIEYIEVHSEVIQTPFKTINVIVSYPKKNPYKIEAEIAKSMDYIGLFDDIS